MKEERENASGRPGRAKESAPYIYVLLVILGFVGISVVRFAAAGRDDSIIVLWSGKTFTFTHWFINYNGAQEELSSSIIGPLIAAVGYWLTPLTPLLFVKSVLLLAAICCLCLVWTYREKIFPDDFPRALIPAVIFSIAMSPAFEYWALGGLEAPVEALLFIIAPLAQIHFYLDRSRFNGVIFALSLLLISLIRTEGFIYTFAAIAFVLVVRNRRFSFWVAPLGAAISLTILSFIVRLFFTGSIWPNPTIAKISGIFAQLETGYPYLLSYYARLDLFAWLQGIGTIGALLALFYYTFLRRGKEALGRTDLITITFSLYILLHEVFTVFSGGDWMEYYRFFVPTIPLKVLLSVNLFGLCAGRISKYVRTSRAYIFSAFVVILCVAAVWQQTYSLLGGYGRGCATPITSIQPGRTLSTAIERTLVTHNCTQSRDERAILPFIENELSKYVARVGQVRVATYQAGYFPYHIRERFPTDKVFFIDTLGLANRAIAQAGSKGRQSGLADGEAIDRILEGKVGRLSRVVQEMRPNMVYELDTTPEERRNFDRLGYTVVWDRQGAVVFFKDR